MFRRTKSGAVKHLYNPETILKCLQLARCKKAGCSVQDVLVEAAGLLLDDDDAKKVGQDFQDGDAVLPAVDLIRSARLRLDMLSVVYQQRYFLRSNVVRYLLIDSSPQLGFKFLCTIEDVFVIPSSSTFSLLTSIKQLDLHNEFESSHELAHVLDGQRHSRIS